MREPCLHACLPARARARVCVCVCLPHQLKACECRRSEVLIHCLAILVPS